MLFNDVAKFSNPFEIQLIQFKNAFLGRLIYLYFCSLAHCKYQDCLNGFEFLSFFPLYIEHYML